MSKELVDPKDLKVGGLYQYEGLMIEVLDSAEDFWTLNTVLCAGFLRRSNMVCILDRDRKTPTTWSTPILKIIVAGSGVVGWIRPTGGKFYKS